MASESSSEPGATGASHDGSQEERLTRVEDAQGRVEARLDTLIAAVDKLTPTHAEAEQQQESRLDRASSVAERVREELERRDKAEADQRQQAADHAERESTRERLAKLEEARPEPPLRHATRFMWGDPRRG